MTRRWRVFALCALFGVMSGCALYPSQVSAIAPERDFSKLSCEQLAAEGARITENYEQMRGTMKSNTRNVYARLNGEARAVNDSIRINGCRIASVEIPSELEHHKYPGSPE
jgi:hypothetical protein